MLAAPVEVGGPGGSGQPRLVWVTEHHPPSRGGMAQSSDRIVGGLRRAGLALDVCHLTRQDRPWSVTGPDRGRLLACPLGDDPEHALRRAADVVERRHSASPYDVVVAFGGTYPLLLAPTLAAWLKRPLVTLLRGNDLDTGLFSVRRQGVVLEALRRSAAVVAVARSMADRTDALLGSPAAVGAGPTDGGPTDRGPAERSEPAPAVEAPEADLDWLGPTGRRSAGSSQPVVEWIPNGIDLADWSPLDSERAAAAAWRREHVPDGRLAVGVVGQLKQKKGIRFLLDAIARTALGHRLHLVLVGELDADVAGWLTGPPARADLTTTHLPFLDRFELLSLLPGLDVVALPSFYDGLPNVALEAGALGLPLLCSDAGGLADLVPDDAFGWTFPAGDEVAVGEALRRLVASTPDDRHDRGAALARRVRASFTAEDEVRRYAARLRQVIEAWATDAPDRSAP